MLYFVRNLMRTDYRPNYNRLAAKKYAEEYALTPNPAYPYYSDNDCTNFISQSLRAGGLKYLGTKWNDYNSWFCNTTKSNVTSLKKVSLTWRSARYFRKHWGNENDIGENRSFIYREISLEEAIQNFHAIYSLLDIGDVVQHINYQNSTYPHHSQIIHSKVFNASIVRDDLLVAQHSANKKNISLYNYISNLKNKNKRILCLYKIIKDM